MPRDDRRPAFAGVDPGSHRGVVLLVGVVALVAFSVMRTSLVLGADAPVAADLWWNDLMTATRSDIGLVVAWVPAVVGGTVGVLVVAAGIISLFVWRRRRADAAILAAAVVAVVAIGAPLAALIARARPTDSLAESAPTSFPSGHTAVATALAVIIGLLVHRWWVWTAGAAWVLLMMWSRTYLHAHWLTDVVAGMLEGVAVATLVWTAAHMVLARRASPPGEQDLVDTVPPWAP